MKRVLLPTLVLLVVVGAAGAADRTEGKMFATRSVVYARHGMVAAAHPLAVQIGIDILKRNGSAVDAAIAVNAALGFLEPVACGIGGDLFAIVWEAEGGKLHGLNGSGRAPRALTADKVATNEMFTQTFREIRRLAPHQIEQNRLDTPARRGSGDLHAGKRIG